MKTRLQLLLLSSLPPKGFALPTVLVIGLVLTTLGVALISRSQKNMGTAVAQANTAKVSNITEAGISQYLSFLDNNRVLLTYPSCVGTYNSDGSCPDNLATQRSWSTVNASGSTVLPAASSGSSGSGTCPSSETSPQANKTPAAQIATVWSNSSNTSGWRDIGIGQFRLVGYSYTASDSSQPNTAPGAGTLILEGRVNQNGAGGDDAARTAKSRIAVSFPVTLGPSATPSPGNRFPSVWAQSFSFNGNPDIYGNVWDSSPCLSGSTGMDTSRIQNVPLNPIVVARATNNGNNPQYGLSSTAGTNTIKRLAFPSLPNNNTYPLTNPPGATVNAISCPYAPNNVTFPRTGDRDMNGNTYGSGAPANATYIYRVCGNNNTSAMTVQNSTITLGQSGQERFIFYVDGDVVTQSNGHIVPTGTTRTRFYIGPSGRVDIGSNGNKGIANRPTALQFYLYAQDLVSSATSVSVTGNGAFYGFVFAPFANAKMWGTGDTAGAVWARTYSGGGNGSVLQGIFDATDLDVTLPSAPVPQLGTINSWVQQPVP